MKTCLIFLEKHYEEDCTGMLGAAARLYEDRFTSTAVYTDSDPQAARGSVDELIRITHETGSSFGVRELALTLQALQSQKRFDCILIAATHFGRMLAPYLSAILGCGLVADVTDVACNGGTVQMIRPAYGGRLTAVVEATGSGPVMISLRPGVFSASENKKETKETVFSGIIQSRTAELLESIEKPERPDIRTSEVLVSGGGGAMDHFDLLQELAGRLGGTVSASRKAVDEGKADRIIQVGQSGRFVRPKLYIAEGIYGALQHVAGIKHAENIIAVNTDPLAPICSLADIVVQGDAAEFTKKLIHRIDRG